MVRSVDFLPQDRCLGSSFPNSYAWTHSRAFTDFEAFPFSDTPSRFRELNFPASEWNIWLKSRSVKEHSPKINHYWAVASLQVIFECNSIVFFIFFWHIQGKRKWYAQLITLKTRVIRSDHVRRAVLTCLMVFVISSRCWIMWVDSLQGGASNLRWSCKLPRNDDVRVFSSFFVLSFFEGFVVVNAFNNDAAQVGM